MWLRPSRPGAWKWGDGVGVDLVGVLNGALVGFWGALVWFCWFCAGSGGRLEQANRQILEVFGGRFGQALAVGLSRQIDRF